MYKNYLYTPDGRYYRGTYQTPANAIRYGRRDLEKVNQAFHACGHDSKPRALYVEDGNGNKLYKIEMEEKQC